MRNRTFADLDRVVAIGGGHGLGRVMSSLSSLGSRLTGIVTTTDNGGSTGRIRRSEGGIAWGDMRNCLNQLITEPSVASAMFEYRFGGNGELSGHNLGNLMLKALDHLSVRPLEAINLIRNLLKVDAFLIPMSEHPVDLMAIDTEGHEVYGEVNIDQLTLPLKELMIYPERAGHAGSDRRHQRSGCDFDWPRQFLYQPDARPAGKRAGAGAAQNPCSDGLYRQSGTRTQPGGGESVAGG